MLLGRQQKQQLLTMLPRSARNRDGSKEKNARWCMSGSQPSVCIAVSSAMLLEEGEPTGVVDGPTGQEQHKDARTSGAKFLMALKAVGTVCTPKQQCRCPGWRPQVSNSVMPETGCRRANCLAKDFYLGQGYACKA